MPAPSLSVDVDGGPPGPSRERIDTTIKTHDDVAEQHAEATAIDEAKVEAFATKIVTDLGIGHSTLLSYWAIGALGNQA